MYWMFECCLQILEMAAATNGRKLPKDFLLASVQRNTSTDGASEGDEEHAYLGGHTMVAAEESEAMGDEHSSLLGPSSSNVKSTYSAGKPRGSGSQDGLPQSTRRRSGSNHRHSISSQLADGWRILRTLTVAPLGAYTRPLALAWIGLCGGWYCAVLWMPKYFQLRGASEVDMYAQTFAVALANLPGK